MKSPAPERSKLVPSGTLSVQDMAEMERLRAGAQQTLAVFAAAVERAVAQHLAAGRSVYGLDEHGQVIEVRPEDRPDLQRAAGR